MPRLPDPRGFVAHVRSVWRGLFRRSEVEAEMREEFRHHIDLRTEHLVRTGLSRREAAHQAHVEFGHVERHREEARSARGLRPFDRIRFSWVDLKLGVRMLWKNPGLTVVALFALALGIPVGMAPMHLSNAIEAPLPEDPENRIRGIRYYDPATTSLGTATFYDLELLRERSGTFEAVGAFRSAAYNIESEDGRAAPVSSAEVTASVFDMLGTPPLMGRVLGAADELPGAPRVVVLGHDLWNARFAADPAIVGRTIRIARLPHVVVGVMPPKFLFPAAQQAWVPLPEEDVSSSGEGRGLFLMGRLADGMSPEAAQAEVDGVVLGVRHELPEARARLRPEVVPFGFLFMAVPRNGLEGVPEFHAFQLLALVLLLVACGNVAMLVFARTATRFRELAVRTALGASRGRIVSQIFAETLVLAVLAAGVGLTAIDWALGRLRIAMLVGETTLPYWLTLGVTSEAVAWALALATVSATAAGVVPAIRITGRRVQESIRRADAGRSGIRFGGVTSALVVADVAVAVAVVGLAWGMSEQLSDAALADALTGIPAEEYLAVEVRMPVDPMLDGGPVDADGITQRLGAAQQAIVERLEAEPGVRGVAVAEALPRMDHPSRRVEVEGSEGAAGAPGGRYVRTTRVDVGFFQALGQPVLAGRAFSDADLATAVPPVIVNTVFADRLLGLSDPVGRRVRLVGSGGRPDGPWQEIVGVVGHLGVNLVNPQGDAGLYIPAAPGEIHPMQIAVHASGTPIALAPRVRDVVAEVDPDAILGPPVVLSEVHQGDWYLMIAAAGGLGLLVVILVTLAASAVYAVMSFSVSERTREIAIRVALGSGRSSLVYTILRRSATQIALGALLGIPLAAMALRGIRTPATDVSPSLPPLVLAAAAGVVIVGLVGLFSCAAPMRRALGIEASEALKGVD